jgi:uncharacterized SAM-binding protein YcdF (DUF218 family)
MNTKVIIHFLTNPIIGVLFLTILSWVLFRLKLELIGQLSWMLSGLYLFFVLFSPLPSYLLLKLEKSELILVERVKENSTDFNNILVFAAGFTNDTSLHANSQLSETMLQRVVEGVRVYHKIGAKKLILSGPCKDERGCQAEAAAEVARSLRVPTENIAIITAGHNTIEELEAYLTEYGNESKLIAVSSARHLQRIKLIADYLGLEVELSASDYEIKRENDRSNSFEPGFKGIGYTEMFLHEWLGMWYTRWYFFKRRETKRPETGEGFRFY